jgi:integrase
VALWWSCLRKALPTRSAFGIHKALRQVLHYAVRAKLIDENPAAHVPNPEPKRTEVQTFSLGELEIVAAGLSPAFHAVPVFAALTGLRPCEWMALERRDVDRQAGIVTVRQTVVEGKVKPYGKTDRSLRSVPLPARAAEALDELPVRLDTACCSPRRVGPARAAAVALARMGSGATGCRGRAPDAVRDASHVREPFDRRRRLAFRAVAAYGHLARDA